MDNANYIAYDNLFPTINLYKNKIRNYLINELRVTSFFTGFLEYINKTTINKKYSKYNIWYWKP